MKDACYPTDRIGGKASPVLLTGAGTATIGVTLKPLSSR